MFADPLLDQALTLYDSSWEHLASLLPLDELGLDHDRRTNLDPIVMCYQPEDIGVIIGETFRPETIFSESTGINFSLDLHIDLGQRDEETDLMGRSCAGVMMSFVPIHENDSPAAGILMSCSLNNFLDPFQATTHVGFTVGKIIGQNSRAATPNDIFLFTNELKEVIVLHNTLLGHYRDMLIILRDSTSPSSWLMPFSHSN